MTDFEEIAKSLQEIEKKIVLMGASHEEVLIQKVADGARRRLLYILMIFLAGVGIAGLFAYNYFVETTRAKILAQFNENELPKIKNEITSRIENEFSINNPDFQSKIEFIIDEQIEKTTNRFDNQLNTLIKEVSPSLGGEKFIAKAEQSIKHDGDTRTQEGWSFYGIYKNDDKSWKVRYFEPADMQELDAIPTEDVTIIAKGNINLRKSSPLYSARESYWNYSAAQVTGSIKKTGRAIITKVNKTDTVRGTYVWVEMSIINRGTVGQ